MTKKPVSGTKEWADGSANIQRGCEHACWYCFARVKDPDPATWSHVISKPLGEHKKRPNRIMFPTQHDITPDNLKKVLGALPILLDRADNLLLVSKPHFMCIKDVIHTLWALYNQKILKSMERIMFRFTIGTRDNEELAFWEPGAPTYEERVASLVYAHSMGFQTSVSCEPALGLPEMYPGLVKDLSPYVTDAIWIGKMNHVLDRLLANNVPAVVMARGLWLEKQWMDTRVFWLYNKLKDNPKVKWKDSIKEVVGLDRPTTPGDDR